MGKKTKRVQEILNNVEKKFHFMTVAFEGKGSVIQEGESRNGRLKYVDEDTFLFKEISTHARQSFPERKYQDLTGSLHGKISKNDHGAILHVYVRYEDYQNMKVLADIFEREVELMCNDICDMDIKQEVATCGK